MNNLSLNCLNLQKVNHLKRITLRLVIKLKSEGIIHRKKATEETITGKMTRALKTLLMSIIDSLDDKIKEAPPSIRSTQIQKHTKVNTVAVRKRQGREEIQ